MTIKMGWRWLKRKKWGVQGSTFPHQLFEGYERKTASVERASGEAMFHGRVILEVGQCFHIQREQKERNSEILNQQMVLQHEDSVKG